MLGKSIFALVTFAALASAVPGRRQTNSSGSDIVVQQPPADLVKDPLVYGPEIELIHLFYDEWPTGIAVSKSGRLFSNYPPGLDKNNTNNGSNGKYTIAELHPNNTETPYPSVEINSPPGGAINYTTNPPTGANYANYLIGSQSVVVDSKDRVWILDTGRALTPNGTLVTATYGGPKIVGIDLTTNQVFKTILFPLTVAYPDSYLNDIRFDLRASAAPGGQGIAYITDSSLEGRNGLIMVDLGTGISWRHLDGSPTVHAEQQFITYIFGLALYAVTPGKPLGYTGFGSDGIALSADGETLYWKDVAGRLLYSIPTARLKDNSEYSEILAQGAINTHTQSGVSDGMETDTNGFIYHGVMGQNGVGFFNPANGSDTMFVRDPRLNWIDTLSTGFDGYLYWTTNQLFLSSSFYPGTDRRQRPFSLWRAKLPNGGTKPILA